MHECPVFFLGFAGGARGNAKTLRIVWTAECVQTRAYKAGSP